MKDKIIITVLIQFLFCSLMLSQNVPVVPLAKEVSYIDEKFSIAEPSFSIKLALRDTSNLYIPVSELKETFFLIKNYQLDEKQQFSRLIWIGIPSENEAFNKLCEENEIHKTEKIGDQGYVLVIKDDLIIISANSKAGIYYGVQTLKQLIRNNRNSSFIEGVKIIDWPSFEYRGILDDISRGPVPTMDYMKQQIRRLAELKMNSLQYYIENVVKTKSHPAFAPPDGSITIDDIKELSEYAKKYHVMLIGNFQSFGHFEKILSHPDYSHLGESGTLLSPAFPASEQLLRDIYTEMVPAFGAPFFNVDADETFDLGKGASKPMVDSLGIAVVYTNHVKKMYEILKDLNTRMMIWTDILLKHPESLGMLPKDIIMMTWGYDASDSFDDMILPVKEAGYEFTISPGVLNSYSTMPDYSVTIKNIKNFARDGVKHGAMGMVLTVWDDGGSAFFSRDWYGIAYGAEQSWNPNDENLSGFNERFNSAIYVDETNSLTKAIWKLVELSKISVTDGMKEKSLWMKVIPDSGESLRMTLEDWDKVIAVLDSAQSILNASKPRLYKDDYDYFRFTTNQYRYFAELRFNLAEAAKLYSDAFDKQNDDRSDARKQLVDAINIISNSRSSLTNLYNDYVNLWLRENKTHAVNIVLKNYQDQIDDLRDIEERIFSSLKRYDTGLSILSPVDVRLGIEEAEGKYFREWMMINPAPNPEGSEGNKIDYLAAMDGELNTVPKVSQEFEYDGKIYRWRRTASGYFDVVDLAEEFPRENMNAVTYAFAHIDSPDGRIVIASIGSTDGVDVIINGDLVYSKRNNRPLKVDEDKFKLPLKKGRNNLMLKLFQGDGEWKFTFRLPEYKVNNSKNRYKIPDAK